MHAPYKGVDLTWATYVGCRVGFGAYKQHADKNIV